MPRTPEKVAPKPLRLKPSVAAKMLGIGYTMMNRLIHRGLFTTFDNGQRGIKRRIFLLTSEVELYATQGEEALREHRARQKRRTR